MKNWTSRSQITGDVVYFQYGRKESESSYPQVFVWDLDKTYLDTKIDSLVGLLQTAMERSVQKKNVPGTKVFLQCLSESWKQKNARNYLPIYFITASPPQMEERVMEKIRYDKIQPLGSFFKDNLKNIHPKRFRRLTKQVGYKLQALLQLRTKLAPNVRQILWGDDSESDAIIYNLYSDICSRRLSTVDLRATLKSLSVLGEQTDYILQLQSQIPEADPVERIFINLATDTDPDYYLKFGRRTLPTYNTLQIVLDLYQMGQLNSEAVIKVAFDMINNYGFSKDQLAKSYDDLIRRKVLLQASVIELTQILQEASILSKNFKPSIEPIAEHNENVSEPWVSNRIEYLNEYR